MEKKKKPAIRFKGFTDSWEQRKFDKWGDFYYGHSCPKWSVTEDATIPCIRYGELYTKFGAKIDKVYSYTNMPTEKLRFSKGTEVLIPRVGEDPMDYNHCTWLSLKDVAIGEMISVFNTDQDPLFSATMFNATLQKEFAIRVEGGSVTNLYFDKLRNIDISYPLLAEQKKIAAFFENLDHLITLHQRKYDKLQIIKKAMLEKMFPQNGSCFPEIRFKGFTDSWEQRKVGDFLTESRVRGNTGLDAKKLTVKLWGKGVVEKNDFGGSEHTQYFTRRKGQFIYSKLDFLNSAFGVIPEKLDNYESTADLPAFDLDGMNPYFMYFVAIQESFYLKHGSIADGSRKAKRIHADTFLNMPVMVPTIDEQNLIVDFLQHLDHLITLHQREVEKLQNIKKSMLETMFV